MMDRRIFLTTVAGLLVIKPVDARAQQAGGSGGTSPLPPATPVQDLRSLVGKWEGRVTSSGLSASEPITWTVDADGSYDLEPFGQKGRLEIREGKVRFKNLATGRTGTVTLHEGGGRRILRGVADDGLTWELTPAATKPLPTGKPGPAIRIGILTMTSERERIRRAFDELGYVDGKTVALEYRLGPPDRLPDLAAELVRLNVNVLVAVGTAPAHAAKRATATIPIVFIAADPLAAGLVPSLARPGANLTGLSAASADISAKQLQLLKEAVPVASRVGILADPTHPAAAAQLRELDVAAQALNLQLRTFQVRAPGDVEPAFVAMQKEAVEAVVVLPHPVLVLTDSAIVRLAAKQRLPLIAELRQYADAGGLMSYGTSYVDLVRRAARYVDRVLKGARPADLPVEQPTKFELVINLKTAKALGLTISPALLLRADQVIE